MLRGRRRFIVAALVVAVVGLARAQDSRAILGDVDWNDSGQRWSDIADNPYASGQKSSYDYPPADQTNPSVYADYSAVAPTFRGTLHLSGLKPNFAYQIKLNGKPSKPDPSCPIGYDPGDDWANEQLGYAGRWWLKKLRRSDWTVVSEANSTDQEYEYWKARNFTDGTYYYFFEGYLLFDWVVTDGNGTATKDFALDSSLHVLWKTTQRQPTPSDATPTTHTVVADGSSPWYEETYATKDVSIYGEWESGRPLPGALVLPEGHYNVRVFLTEESFHSSDGSWATVMACDDVTFTVQHETKPVRYWAVICGIANYKSINDLSYTDDDARDLANALKQFADWQGSDQIELLIDSAASKRGIRQAIERMGQKAGADTSDHDVCLLFFSGHGTQVSDSSGDDVDGIDEAICAWDTKVRGRRISNVITDDELGAWLATYLPGDADVVAVFDTCFSGGLAQSAKGLVVKSIPNPAVPPGAKARRHFAKGLAKRLVARRAARGGGAGTKGSGSEDIGGTNTVVLMACAEGNLSYESPALQNGVYTEFILEGIGNPTAGAPADDGDGALTAEEDHGYAAPRATAWAAANLDVTQTPKLYDGNPYAQSVILHATPPEPLHDVAVVSLVAPGSVVQGDTVEVVVTLANEGNQSESTTVTLTDQTAGSEIGSQAVTDLAPGESVDLTFTWDTTGAATVDHTLVASAQQVPGETDLADNGASTVVSVHEPGSVPTMHVASIEMSLTKKGKNWTAEARVTVLDSNNSPVGGATVSGDWTLDGKPLSSTSALTDGSGVAVLKSKRVKAKSGQTFTVTIASVVKAGYEFDPSGESQGEISVP